MDLAAKDNTKSNSKKRSIDHVDLTPEESPKKRISNTEAIEKGMPEASSHARLEEAAENQSFPETTDNEAIENGMPYTSQATSSRHARLEEAAEDQSLPGTIDNKTQPRTTGEQVPADHSLPETVGNRTQAEKVYQSKPIEKEATIFKERPVDDVVLYVANFIRHHCRRENVEIEAKLGRFVDKASGERINIGACTETVLSPSLGRSFRFESDITQMQHRHFNKLFNDLYCKSQPREYKGEKIRYIHTRETDRFYEIPGSRSKWRVTTDQKTGKIVPNGIVEKIRVTDLNIHSPNEIFDYRISINIEKPREMPTTKPVYERNKDRLSYKHGGITFDLTQVKDETGRIGSHELELEMDTFGLANECEKMERNGKSEYPWMIESLVNNLRLLSRKALRA